MTIHALKIAAKGEYRMDLNRGKYIYYLTLSFFICLSILSAMPAYTETLHEAVEKGSLARVNTLLAQHADINARDLDGLTPLDCAFRSVSEDIDAKRAVSPQINSVIGLLVSRGGVPGNEYGWNSIARYKEEVIRIIVESLPDGKLDLTPEIYPYDLLLYCGTPAVPRSLAMKIIYKFSMTARRNKLRTLTVKLGGKGFLENTSRIKNYPSAEHAFYYQYEGATLRRTAILLSQMVEPRPSVSTDASRWLADGNVAFKSAQDESGYSEAERSFKKAVALSPWWSDGYYNLAQVQEKLDLPGEAKMNLEYYLMSVPDAPDSSQVQARIYELESMEKRRR